MKDNKSAKVFVGIAIIFFVFQLFAVGWLDQLVERLFVGENEEQGITNDLLVSDLLSNAAVACCVFGVIALSVFGLIAPVVKSSWEKLSHLLDTSLTSLGVDITRFDEPVEMEIDPSELDSALSEIKRRLDDVENVL